MVGEVHAMTSQRCDCGAALTIPDAWVQWTCATCGRYATPEALDQLLGDDFNARQRYHENCAIIERGLRANGKSHV